MQRFKGVIFDLDGTLVESQLNFSEIKRQIGCPPDEDILDFLDSLSGDHKEHCEAVIVGHELEDAEKAQCIEGAEELVNFLHQQQVPMAIVTRNQKQAAEIKIKANRLPIETLLTRHDAPAKPDPAALLMIAGDWQLPCEELIYVGDYLYDIEAANNAKMTSCLFAMGESPDYSHRADLVVDKLLALKNLVVTRDEF